MSNYFTKALGIAPRTEKKHVDNVLNSILYSNLVGFNNVVFYNYDQEDYIKKGYKENAEVYTITNKIVSKTLVAPVYLYEDKPDTKALKYRRYKNSKRSSKRIEINKHRLYVEKALEFATGAKDLQELLDTPNPKQSWRELSELARLFYFNQGETFYYRETADDSDIALELYVAPANLMTPVYGGGDVNNPITGWKLNLLNGHDRVLDAKDVLQIKRANPEFNSMGSQDRGMSFIQAGQKYLQLNDASLKAWISSQENEGAKGIVAPNTDDPKGWLQPDQVDATQKAVDSNVNGHGNKGRVVTVGMPVQYHSMALSPTANAVLEALKFSGFKVARLWGANPILFDEDPTYTNLLEAKESFVIDVIVPYLNVEEDSLNRWLVKPFSERDNRNYKIDYDISVYDELKLSTDEVDALLSVLTINEVRVMLGYDEIPDSDAANQVFVASGKVPLSDFDMGLTLNDDLNK